MYLGFYMTARAALKDKVASMNLNKLGATAEHFTIYHQNSDISELEKIMSYLLLSFWIYRNIADQH